VLTQIRNGTALSWMHSESPVWGTALFIVTVLVSAALAVDRLYTVVRRATTSPEYSYIIVVLPLSLALIYLNRRSIFAICKVGSRLGILLVSLAAPAFFIYAVAVLNPSADLQLSVSLAGLVTLWIAAFYVSFGSAASSAALFPLLFLYFLVPVPGNLMARAVAVLQYASADAAGALFNIAGVPVIRHGQTFVLVNQQIEVAAECSGIRSSIALLITAVIFGHLFLQRVPSKVLLTASIVPLAVIKNGIRIFTLSVLGTYVNPGFLTGRLHHQGGVVFFALALAVLTVVLLALRKLERSRAAPTQPGSPLQAKFSKPRCQFLKPITNVSLPRNRSKERRISWGN